MNCNKCNKKVSFTTKSPFNLQDICQKCGEMESKHPLYWKAMEMWLISYINNEEFKGLSITNDLK